jgi:hypothetical protein
VKATELREPFTVEFTVERAIGVSPATSQHFFPAGWKPLGALAWQPGIPGTADLETFSCIFVIPFSGPISWTARTSTVPRGSGTNGSTHPTNRSDASQIFMGVMHKSVYHFG